MKRSIVIQTVLALFLGDFGEARGESAAEAWRALVPEKTREPPAFPYVQNDPDPLTPDSLTTGEPIIDVPPQN